MADSDWTPSDPPVVVDPLSSSEEEEMKLMLTLEKLKESIIELTTDIESLRKEVQRCSKFPALIRAYFENLRKVLERVDARMVKETLEFENRCKMIEQEIAAMEVTAGHVMREEEEDSRTNQEARKRVAVVLVEDADIDDDQEVQTTPPIKARKVDVQTPPVPASPPAGQE